MILPQDETQTPNLSTTARYEHVSYLISTKKRLEKSNKALPWILTASLGKFVSVEQYFFCIFSLKRRNLSYSPGSCLAGNLNEQQWYGYVSNASLIYLNLYTDGKVWSEYVCSRRRISTSWSPSVGRDVMLVLDISLAQTKTFSMKYTHQPRS